MVAASTSARRIATGGGTADRSQKLSTVRRAQLVQGATSRLSTADTPPGLRKPNAAFAWSSAEDALVSAHGYSPSRSTGALGNELRAQWILAHLPRPPRALTSFGSASERRAAPSTDASRSQALSAAAACQALPAASRRECFGSGAGSGPASGGGGVGPGHEYASDLRIFDRPRERARVLPAVRKTGFSHRAHAVPGGRIDNTLSVVVFRHFRHFRPVVLPTPNIRSRATIGLFVGRCCRARYKRNSPRRNAFCAHAHHRCMCVGGADRRERHAPNGGQQFV